MVTVDSRSVLRAFTSTKMTATGSRVVAADAARPAGMK
jgi:hypothetical protein